MIIEPFAPSHADAVAQLSLRAWSPVFDSLKEALAPAVWQQFYPEGWRASQEKSVRDTCANADMKTWVAIDAGAVAGFVAIAIGAMHRRARRMKKQGSASCRSPVISRRYRARQS